MVFNWLLVKALPVMELLLLLGFKIRFGNSSVS